MGARFYWTIVISVVLLSSFRSAPGEIIAHFDFESVDGTSVPNLGVGPAGILLGGASVADGVLMTDGVTRGGFDIPLGELNPFGGDADWSVQFDFSTEDTEGGVLFSSDSAECGEDGCNDAEQAATINVFLTGDGTVAVDAWYVGAFGSDPGFNDGDFHTVRIDYTAAEGLWALYVDDLEEPVGEEAGEGWLYSRDATADRTRIGAETNPDAGVDWDPGQDGLLAAFDNFLIEAPAPPPVLLTVDRDSGTATLESILSDELNFGQLSITSSQGTVDEAAWQSITGNLDGAGDGSVSSQNWSIETRTANEVTEVGESATLAPEQSIDLGALWVRSPLEDLRVNILDLESGEIVSGAVVFAGDEVVFGDLNLDGELSELDWELFRTNYGQSLDGLTGVEAYFQSDLNTDGIHDGEDFIAFANAYDTLNGAGAFAQLAAVPEPESVALTMVGVLGLLGFRRRRSSASSPSVDPERMGCGTNLMRRVCRSGVLAVVTAILVVGQSARAELLVEYDFANGTTDISGNGRDGNLDPGEDGDPSVAGGVLNLTSGFLEGLIVPLEDANPFDGSKDFTIDVTFNANRLFWTEEDDEGNLEEIEVGHLLISSANLDDPTSGDNRSMSLFIEPEGDIVYDNFFVGEVRVTPPEFVLDQQPHELRVTYAAPEGADEPGMLMMRLDGLWLGGDEIQPDVPDIHLHEVRLGGSLNDEFPFECEGEDLDGAPICFIREFSGSLDDVRIYDEAFVPSNFSAEVNRANGDITLKGGEFQRDVSFYEITSEAGALNADAWSAGNMDSQNVDPDGEGVGETWDAMAADTNRVAEGFLTGSTMFDDGTAVVLSGAWGGGEEDLALSFVAGDGEDRQLFEASVTYVGEGNGNPGSVCQDDTMGDIDGNGTVEFADFLILSGNFGLAVSDHTQGDIDCDGSVAFADFLILSGNFGQTVGGAQSVPEPSAWISLLSAFLLGSKLVRRRR